MRNIEENAEEHSRMKRNGSLFLFLIFFLLVALVFCSSLVLSNSSVFMIPAYDDPELSSTLVRGSILDRNGKILSIQAPVYGFSIHLADASPAEAASFISGYTDENAISISERIDRGEEFVIITDILSAEEMDECKKDIRTFGLSDDITLTTKETRISTLPEIIGQTDSSLHGISGIEKLFDSELSARPSLHDSIAYGKDIKLSIDSDIQAIFSDIIKSTDAQETAALLLNGKAIALYGKADDEILRSTVTAIGDDDYHSPFPYETQPLEGGYSVYSANINPLLLERLNQVIPEL